MIQPKDQKQASVGSGTTITCDYPNNAANDALFASFNLGATDPEPVSNPTITATGWTRVLDNGSFGSIGRRCAVYYRAGGQTGSATFTTDIAVRGNVNILSYDKVALSSVVNGSAFKNDASLGVDHATTLFSTSVNGCMIVAAWYSRDTGISFISTSLSEILVNIPGTTGSAERPTLIAESIQAVAGSVSAQTARTNANSFCQSIIWAIAPYEGPTEPVVTSPTAGLSITQGVTFNVQWSAATSPTAAQSSLQYKPQYTLNGIDYFNILGGSGLTSAGVTSASWNTTGLALTSTARIRVQAYDPALTLYSLDYGYSGIFSLVAETAPAAPTGLSPSGGVQDKTNPITLSYQANDATGNPVTESTWRWSRDNFSSHDSGDIVVSGSAQTKSIDFSGEAQGAIISYKVKRKGLSLYSAYSATASFQVATAPSAPTIADPTNASPPTSPFPVITYSATGQNKRRMRVVEGGVQQYDSETDTSLGSSFITAATSFKSPYKVKDGVPTDLYISIRNVYGLWSPEAHEQFTPSYAGPAAAEFTAEYIPDSESGGGYVQIIATQSGDYSVIYAVDGDWGDSGALLTEAGEEIETEGGEIITVEFGGDVADAYPISPQITAASFSFQDRHLQSGRARGYFIRSFEDVGGGVVLSTDTEIQAVTPEISFLHYHAVTKQSTEGNAASFVVLISPPPHQYKQMVESGLLNLAGRGSEAAVFGLITERSSNRPAIITYVDTTTLNKLLALNDAGEIVCERDRRGNKTFGWIEATQIEDNVNWHRISLSFRESQYTEAVS